MLMTPNAGVHPTLQAVGWNDQLSTRCLKSSDRHGSIDSNRFSKRLDTLNFVHCLGREVGFAAARTRPQRDGFNNKQGSTLAKAARYVLELQGGASTVRAMMLNRGRR